MRLIPSCISIMRLFAHSVFLRYNTLRFFQNSFLHAARSFEPGHKSCGFSEKCFFLRKEKTLIHAVFAVLSENALIRNSLRIILK